MTRTLLSTAAAAVVAIAAVAGSATTASARGPGGGGGGGVTHSFGGGGGAHSFGGGGGGHSFSSSGGSMRSFSAPMNGGAIRSGPSAQFRSGPTARAQIAPGAGRTWSGSNWNGRRFVHDGRRHFRGRGFAFGFGAPYYDYGYYDYGYADDCYQLQRGPYGWVRVYVCGDDYDY
jgi:hypothetical protein